jgi:cell cycle arrest protein BUB2
MAILQDPTLRYRIWKILLRVNDLPAETFLEYVARGPCEVREKIRNDTFRCVVICRIAESPLILQQSFSTLATDRGFKERVREDMLVRLLDAFVWRNYGKPHCGPFSIPYAHHFTDRQESSQQLGFTYVQGMNVLAAPFLYTMPSELEAFFCFAKFIEESCPLYVQPTLEGVHRGLRVRVTTVDSGCNSYTFTLRIASRQMPQDCGPRVVQLLALKESFCRIICFSL